MRSNFGRVGNPEEQDPEQGDIGRGHRANRAGDAKLGSAAYRYIELSQSQ